MKFHPSPLAMRRLMGTVHFGYLCCRLTNSKVVFQQKWTNFNTLQLVLSPVKLCNDLNIFQLKYTTRGNTILCFIISLKNTRISEYSNNRDYRYWFKIWDIWNMLQSLSSSAIWEIWKQRFRIWDILKQQSPGDSGSEKCETIVSHASWSEKLEQKSLVVQDRRNFRTIESCGSRCDTFGTIVSSSS